MTTISPAEYETRIHALEKLNATLAAEVDRMRPVVETAIKWNKTNYRNIEEIAFALDALGEACDDYEATTPDTETTNAQ